VLADHPAEALVDRLSEAIQAGILSGEYPLGSRLRQEALAAHYGVSRTPVREALRKLQATELVELHPKRGAVVRGPSPRAVREAYQIRAELESLAVELALPHIGEPELAQLRAAVEEFGAAVDGDVAEPWLHANDRFHDVILRAARNDRLRRTITELHRLFPRNLTWAALRARPLLLAESVEQHRRILEAIENNLPSTARLVMTYHVHRAGELVAEWFEQHRA
jgi:DNA-binding GntR family transcriptional regulator